MTLADASADIGWDLLAASHSSSTCRQSLAKLEELLAKIADVRGALQWRREKLPIARPTSPSLKRFLAKHEPKRLSELDGKLHLCVSEIKPLIAACAQSDQEETFEHLKVCVASLTSVLTSARL